METVAEYLKKKGAAIYSVRPNATVYGALELMAEKNIGAVVVTDEEGKLHGIFSERDFARKMIIKGRHDEGQGNHDHPRRLRKSGHAHPRMHGSHDREADPAPAGLGRREARWCHLHRGRGEVNAHR